VAAIDDLEKYLDSMAPAVGLPVPEQYRAEVLTYLRLASAIAQPLLDAEISDTVEPAPIYRP
jgi:hypothetical protein